MLQEFANVHGHADLDMLGATLPGILDMAADWETLPNMFGKSFWCAAKGADKVGEGLAFARGSRQCNLGLSLQEEWLQRHATVMAETVIDAQEREVHKRCREVGMCVCKGPGVTLHRMHNSFLSHMKKTFKDKRGKTRLEQGEVVCQWQLQTKCQDCEEEPHLPHRHWFHVGAMSFSPYKPTLLGMTEVETQETDLELLHRQCLQDNMPTRFSKALFLKDWDTESRLEDVAPETDIIYSHTCLVFLSRSVDLLR